MKLLAHLALACLFCAGAFAQTPAAEPPKPGEPAATPPPRRTLLKYTPPKGVPDGTRIDGDGGSRGKDEKLPALFVLTPPHAALTTSPQPALFWYQSGGAEKRLEVTVVEPKVAEPVCRLYVDKSTKAGVHRVSLAKNYVTLKPGVTYKWTVAWVPDESNRSLSVIAGGSIKRVEADEKLTAALAEAKGLEKAEVYAQNGIWYDALETISNALEADIGSKELRRARADLLEQAGLKNVAAAERK